MAIASLTVVAALAGATTVAPAARPTEAAPIAATAPGSSMVRLTAGSGVRVRARPEAGAPEVARLPIGVRLDVLRVTAEPVVVGVQRDVWYEVGTPVGPGWVFAPLTVPFDPAKPDEAWLQITRARLAALEPMTGPEETDLARFLRRVLWAGSTDLSRAELASAFVVTLVAAARDTPDCGTGAEGPLCRELVRLFPAELMEDPTGNSGQLFLTVEAIDVVGGLARGTPFEEPVAWAAGDAMLSMFDGELDLGVILDEVQRRDAAYLTRFPDGPHAAEALAAIQRWMDPEWVASTTWTPEERITTRHTLDQLRATVDRSHHVSKAGVLTAIDRVATAVGGVEQAPPTRTPMEVLRWTYTGPEDATEPPYTRALDVAIRRTRCWDGVPYPAFDYTVGGQDAEVSGEWTFKEVPSATGVTVHVGFMNFGKPRTILWDLVMEDGSWHTDNVRGTPPDAFDLKAGAVSAAGRCGERPDAR